MTRLILSQNSLKVSSTTTHPRTTQLSVAKLGLLVSLLAVRKEGKQQRPQEDKEHPALTGRLRETDPEIKVQPVAQDQGAKKEEAQGEAECLKVVVLVLVDLLRLVLVHVRI